MFTWNNLEDPRGFLFIGDPHASSVRPGKRKDDYEKSVLRKLTEAALICTELKLMPIILGDLIHRESENSVGFITRILRVLKSFPCTPLEIEGNHGRHQNQLVDEDVEALLQESGAIILINSNSDLPIFTISGQQVRITVAEFGSQIPYRLHRISGCINLLLTHHDIGFETAYPGAMPIREIQGCDFVVNGHMHKTAPKVIAGETTWFNPGNIEPLSVDCKDHKPAVWEWTPEQREIVPHYLKHDSDCFTLTGSHVLAASSLDGVQAYIDQKSGIPLRDSKFAALLADASNANAVKTDEAAFLIDDLDIILEQNKVSAATATLLRELASNVISEASKNATPN